MQGRRHSRHAQRVQGRVPVVTLIIDSVRTQVYEKGVGGPVMVLLHGGGHSALSWAVFTTEITKLCDAHIIAIDFRGHGGTVTDNDAGACIPCSAALMIVDLSCDTLVSDVVEVLTALFAGAIPPLILLGHRSCAIHVRYDAMTRRSMGGAVAVHLSVDPRLASHVTAMIVIDVVEGAAHVAGHLE